MSNIIKGGRIRSQSYLDLSQRLKPEILKIYDERQCETEQVEVFDDSIEKIEERKKELAFLEEEIQKKREEADKQIEEMLAQTIEKCKAMEQQAIDKKAEILAQAQDRQDEMIQLAYDEAETIKKSAYLEKQSLLESVEGEVVETMISLLRHIISEELNENVEWLKLVVRKMLLQDQTTETFKLRVSIHNMQMIERDKAHFMEGISKVTQIESDETLNDTTCVLETSQGNIEYDVSQGLERMMTEIRILKGIS